MQIYPPDDPFLFQFMLGSIPIALRWYGVLIVGGAMIAAQWSAHRAASRGQDPEHIWNIVVLGMIMGIAGARAYYVAFEWPRFANQSIINIINPATGGLAIHGALIGAIGTAWWYTRRHQLDLREYLDIMMPTFMLAQAIGRWGNFFNQEAYGRPTPFNFGLIIDAPYRVPPYNDLDKYPPTTLFHPTFLYESVWNFMGVVLLVIIERRFRSSLRRGDMVLFYAVIYGLGRLWIEGLRTDSLCADLVGGGCDGSLRVAQLVSIALVVLGLGLLWLNHARELEITDVTSPMPVKPLFDDTPAVPTMPIGPDDLPEAQVTDAMPNAQRANPTEPDATSQPPRT